MSRNTEWSEEEVALLAELHSNRDLTWTDVATKLNESFGNKRSGDGCRTYYRINFADQKTPNPIKAVVQGNLIKELRSDITKLKTGTAFETLVLKAIAGTAPAFSPPPPMPEIKSSKKLTDTGLILALSDHHTNRVVDSRAIEGFNEYNFDVYALRLWNVIVNTIHIARAQYTEYNRISHLSINYLGDIGNDSHRESNKATNQMAENVASLVAAHINAQGIHTLAMAKTNDGKALFPKITIRGVPGNEPRMDKKLDTSRPYRNWDWMIYQWISASLGGMNGRIDYLIPYSMKVCVDEMGWTFLLDHGHEIRGWAGIPYYGIKRSNSQEQYIRRHRGGFEYRISGHIHTGAKIPEYCRAHFIVPSLVGVDGYAHNNLAVTSDIGQTLLAVTKERGVIGEHHVYADGTNKCPFIYDVDLAVEGAHRSMEEWFNKDISI